MQPRRTAHYSVPDFETSDVGADLDHFAGHVLAENCGVEHLREEGEHL